MSRWFRHYAGLCRDAKLVSAAIKSRQPIERVVWIWCAILESAAERDDEGRYAIDHDEIAYFLRADCSDIRAVEDALETMGRTLAGRVVKWGNRQFKSDRSNERVSAYRERKRDEKRDNHEAVVPPNEPVTLQARCGNSPETETETDSYPANTRDALDGLEAKCREAAGAQGNPSPSLFDLSPIRRCLTAGASLEADVLPVIRQITARGHRWQSWRYAERAIMDAKASREAPAPPGEPKARGQPPPRQMRGSSAISAALRDLTAERATHAPDTRTVA